MPLTIRFMRRQDISQVTEIDHEAFPTEWPPTNFPRELENKLAHYIVAYETQEVKRQTSPKPPGTQKPVSVFDRVRRIFSRGQIPQDNKSEEEVPILGYAGMWIMADEAHITSIASRKERRHQGIGEALLICLIEMAMTKHARIVTLEARISNQVAQNLYYKFSFDKLGIRKGYYLDNKEDAVIMSTEYIGSHSFKEKFRLAKQTYHEKWGIITNEISG
ncbi:MAG: ribosomal protein S18-alanine N-acetyltransferase [Dehalococcoidales bacterium]|nr:ribosomal protein S18-alanine N-acetyltransferase [Dehalococcoidales bacterium]